MTALYLCTVVFLSSHFAQVSVFIECRGDSFVQDWREYECRYRVDERRGKLGGHHGQRAVERITVNESLIDIGLEHVKGDIAEGADNASCDDPGVALRLIVPVSAGDLCAYPGHGEFGDEGDDSLDEVVPANKVVYPGTKPCGESSGQRTEHEAREQAEHIAQAQLGTEEGYPEIGYDEDYCCHDAGKDYPERFIILRVVIHGFLLMIIRSVTIMFALEKLLVQV